MPTPYVPPAIDGNGTPMPAPRFSSGTNPRQIGARTITPAPVQRSIAPDPWAMTGPAPRPITEAGGRGMKPPSGPFGLLAAAPEPAPKQQGPYRPMTAADRDLLFSLDGPYTDRPRSNEYMVSPDGPAKQESAVKGR